MSNKIITVLVIVHPELIPPEKVNVNQLEDAKWRTEYFIISALQELGYNTVVQGVGDDLMVINRAINNHNIDVVFNLLEEFDGNPLFDYSIVSYLEMLNVPYTGCNSKGLLLAKDKSLSKKILKYHGILTPDFFIVKFGEGLKKHDYKFPLIVKSKTDEGSFCISQNSVVNNFKKLSERIKFIHRETGSDAIIESFIEGRDIYVSMIGNRRPKVFPILELHFNESDRSHKIATDNVKWNSKYREKNGIVIKVPSDISKKNIEKIYRLSRKIYKTLELTGYARLDLRLSTSGKIYFIEANPNPDIARPDEFAMSAKLSNINYNMLIRKIVQQAA